MMSRSGSTVVAVLLLALFSGGCSLRTLAVTQLGNALAGGGSTFTTDDDPELVGDALPFSLKLMESVLAGAVMDIYSAIIVVVPIIIPLGVAFGIDPIHLGIIFLANLELGYLVPPVGENLFVAAYRFDKPIAELARAVLPMVGILLAGVLLITYVPAISLFLVRILS